MPGILTLTLKAPNKNLQQTTFYFFTLIFQRKIRLGVSCKSSAEQKIHLKQQVLFSLNNNEKDIYECRLLQL